MNFYFVLGCAAMGVLISGWLVWDIRRETKRPAVRVSPELLQRQRDEVIFTAIKVGHQKRAGQQKANWK